MYKIFDIFKDELEINNFMLNPETEWERGSFSKVYFIDDNLCLKVTTDEPYLLFVNLILENEYNKHFIEIYDNIIINDVHYILMERLNHDNSESFIERQFEAERGGYHEKDTCLWLGMNNSFDNALNLLDSWFDELHKEHNLEFDLRFKNILRRSDRTLVIADPWCIK